MILELGWFRKQFLIWATNFENLKADKNTFTRRNSIQSYRNDNFNFNFNTQLLKNNIQLICNLFIHLSATDKILLANLKYIKIKLSKLNCIIKYNF